MLPASLQTGNRITVKLFLCFPETLFNAAGIPERNLIASPETALVRMKIAPRKQRLTVTTAQFPIEIVNRQTDSVPCFNPLEKSLRSRNSSSILTLWAYSLGDMPVSRRKALAK